MVNDEAPGYDEFEDLGWPAHGENGWVLEDYEWDEKTGNGTFIYSNPLVPSKVVSFQMAQPAWPGHNGFGGLVIVGK